MITKEKIEIFNLYNGDVDAFGHGKKQHRKVMTDEEFYLIGGLVQDVSLVKKNLVFIEYEAALNKRLRDNCENEETIEEIKLLSD